MTRKRLLFVCVENSNRSQMAEAFARIHGGDRVEAYSAGSRPSGVVNPKAIAAMAGLGYDLSAHGSKSLDDIPQVEYDFVATMGCGDACPFVRAKQRADWQIPDPKNLPPAEFNKVRDLIEREVIVVVLALSVDSLAQRHLIRRGKCQTVRAIATRSGSDVRPYSRNGKSSSPSIVVGDARGEALVHRVDQERVRAGVAQACLRRHPGERDRRVPLRQPAGKKGRINMSREKMRTVKWVEPRMLVEVAFNERTVLGHLRHSKFVRLREPETLRR